MTGRIEDAEGATGEIGLDRGGATPEFRHTAINLQADASRSGFDIADRAGTSDETISRIVSIRST